MYREVKMTRQEIEVPLAIETPAPQGFFMWAWSRCRALAGWFYSNREEYPPDEAGELMRRYMANKSWFDKISSGWNEQSFLLKTGYFALFTFGSGFAGLLIGSSLILAISAALVFIIGHKLLVSHEANRWAGARIFAAESIALNTNLRATEGLFNTATSELDSIHSALRVESDAMHEQVEALDTEIQILQQQDAVLVNVVEGVERETTDLMHQERAATTAFVTISEDLGLYQQAIQSSRVKVEDIGGAAAQFSEVVEAMQGSQSRLSDAVDRICFFGNERRSVPAPNLKINDDFIAAIMREDEEDDAFIAELTRRNSTTHSVH